MALQTNYSGVGIVTARGNFYSATDYGVLAGGGSVHLFGNVSAPFNSALEVATDELFFSGIATSAGLFGLEMSGGKAWIKDSRLGSTRNALWEGDAISKYGGEDMFLNNVILTSVRADAYSIGGQGGFNSATTLGPVFANRPVDPLVSITGSQPLVCPDASCYTLDLLAPVASLQLNAGTVSGSAVALSGTAGDNVAVAGLQFPAGRRPWARS